MSEHFTVRCKRCTGVVAQCRCPSPSKTERWVDSCLACIEQDHGEAHRKALEDREAIGSARRFGKTALQARKDPDSG